jgi:plastocyanin
MLGYALQGSCKAGILRIYTLPLLPPFEENSSMTRLFALAAIVGLMAGSATDALADDDKPTIVIKNHVFDPAELKVPAGKRITLTVDNQDPTPEEFESRELRVEKVIPGSSKGVVRFGPLDAGTYPFLGEFNQATAKGKVIAE